VTTRFQIGKPYTRNAVFAILAIDPAPTGGPWFTGHTQHNGEWFVFANVGIAGRTGHDYANHWVGDDLHWKGRTGTHKDQPSIQSLLLGPVHIFTRTDSRDPFTYEGIAVPAQVKPTIPVTIVWRFTEQAGRRPELPPEEVVTPKQYFEGATKAVTVNVYERDPAARRACLAAHGTRCCACNVDLGEEYGELGAGFIHVHHLTPLSTIDGKYSVDPVKDLRPLCPNCHGIVHRVSPPLRIEKLKQFITHQRQLQAAQ
jgi:5-methylcytosine-specific restriction protein A